MADDRVVFDWPLEDAGRVVLLAANSVTTEDVIWVIERWLEIKKAEIERAEDKRRAALAGEGGGDAT